MSISPLLGADSPNQADNQNERRSNERVPLAEPIEIVDKHTMSAIPGRISDLSMGGCYADTMNPFREGTAVLVRIERDRKSVELEGDVRFTHPGLGMGIHFCGVTPAQLEILASWLGQQRQDAASPSTDAVSASVDGDPSGLPADALGALIEMLRRKGILSVQEKDELLGPT
ncbi:MAG: PilZ domain-containing protein [Candidatus Acidiferrales bacterium]